MWIVIMFCKKNHNIVFDHYLILESKSMLAKKRSTQYLQTTPQSHHTHTQAITTIQIKSSPINEMKKKPRKVLARSEILVSVV
jgi:hypothetical protein